MENISRVGEVAKLLVDAGLIVLCCFISPFEAERNLVRSLVNADEFVEVFVDVPVEECIKRDPKGLYKKALAGELRNFTGVHSPYETPAACEIRIDGLSDFGRSRRGENRRPARRKLVEQQTMSC